MRMHVETARGLVPLLVLAALGTPSSPAHGEPTPTSESWGLFEAQSDIGSVVPPGTAHYDGASHVYTLTSAGANTWYRVDDFHYLWKKASGDLALTAEVSF